MVPTHIVKYFPCLVIVGMPVVGVDVAAGLVDGEAQVEGVSHAQENDVGLGQANIVAAL